MLVFDTYYLCHTVVKACREQGFHFATTAAQDYLRCLIWDDLVAYLKDKHPDESVLKELDRLRVP